jgi:hypothetical protein
LLDNRGNAIINLLCDGALFEKDTCLININDPSKFIKLLLKECCSHHNPLFVMISSAWFVFAALIGGSMVQTKFNLGGKALKTLGMADDTIVVGLNKLTVEKNI